MVFIVKLQQRHQYLSFQTLFTPVEQIVLKTVHETSQGFRHGVIAVEHDFQWNEYLLETGLQIWFKEPVAKGFAFEFGQIGQPEGEPSP